MAICNILSPFGTFCDHLVHFSAFGITWQEKSGNPGWEIRFSERNRSSAVLANSICMLMCVIKTLPEAHKHG
jgi:hypothetical protein